MIQHFGRDSHWHKVKELASQYDRERLPSMFDKSSTRNDAVDASDLCYGSFYDVVREHVVCPDCGVEVENNKCSWCEREIE